MPSPKFPTLGKTATMMNAATVSLGRRSSTPVNPAIVAMESCKTSVKLRMSRNNDPGTVALLIVLKMKAGTKTK
jgi:hypothetical protein